MPGRLIQGTPDEQANLLASLIHAGFRVIDFTEQAVDLEDVFLDVMQAEGVGP